MEMEICKYVILFLAVFNFGFMVFDGTRALIKGDYIRPRKGQYAGQLGPWTGIVSRLGIEPVSPFMKAVFIVWGLTGLLVTLYFGFYPPSGWTAMFIVNLLSLWYLWAGTISSLLQIILLLVMRFVL